MAQWFVCLSVAMITSQGNVSIGSDPFTGIFLMAYRIKISQTIFVNHISLQSMRQNGTFRCHFVDIGLMYKQIDWPRPVIGLGPRDERFYTLNWKNAHIL